MSPWAYFLLMVLTALLSQVSCLPLNGGAISTREKPQTGETDQDSANLESQLKERALHGDSVEKEDGSGSDEPKGPAAISTSSIPQYNAKQPRGPGQLNRPKFSEEEEEILRTVLITLRDNPGIIQAIIESEKEELQDEFKKQKARVTNPGDSNFWGIFQRPSPQVLRKPKQIEKKAGPKIHTQRQQQVYPDDEEDLLDMKPVLLTDKNGEDKTTQSENIAAEGEMSKDQKVSIIDENKEKESNDESVDDERVDEIEHETDEDDEREENGPYEEDTDENDDNQDDDEEYDEYEDYYEEDDESDANKEENVKGEEEDEIESEELKSSEEAGTGGTSGIPIVDDKQIIRIDEPPKTPILNNEENELLALSRIKAIKGYKSPVRLELPM